MEKIWEGIIVFLGTYDIEKTDKFYRKLLGLPLYKDQGICRIYDIPGGKIGFCTHIPVVKNKKSPIITLLTDKVDEIYNNLLKYDLKIIKTPRKNNKFNIYHFFIEDPNGYTVEIQKFLD